MLACMYYDYVHTGIDCYICSRILHHRLHSREWSYRVVWLRDFIFHLSFSARPSCNSFKKITKSCRVPIKIGKGLSLLTSRHFYHFCQKFISKISCLFVLFLSVNRALRKRSRTGKRAREGGVVVAHQR